MTHRDLLILIAAVFITVGLILCAVSVPMFMSAWTQYKIDCPDGNTKVECH